MDTTKFNQFDCPEESQPWFPRPYYCDKIQWLSISSAHAWAVDASLEVTTHRDVNCILILSTLLPFEIFNYILDDIIRKPNTVEQMAAAQTRITFCASTDMMQWDTDLSQTSKPSLENANFNQTCNTQLAKQNVSSNQTQFCCDCGCMINEFNKQEEFISTQTAPPQSVRSFNSSLGKRQPNNTNNSKPHRIVKETPHFCSDCGCIIDEINKVCESVETKFIPKYRSRTRLVRQYTAPARCR